MNDTISNPVPWGIGRLNEQGWPSFSFPMLPSNIDTPPLDQFEVEGETFILATMAHTGAVFLALEAEAIA